MYRRQLRLNRVVGIGGGDFGVVNDGDSKTGDNSDGKYFQIRGPNPRVHWYNGGGQKGKT